MSKEIQLLWLTVYCGLNILKFFTLISKLIQMAFIKEVPQFTIIINTES